MKQSNTYYHHSQIYPHSQRHAPLLFNFVHNGSNQKGLVLPNFDHIQIYQIVGSSISFFSKHHLMCNISVLEVIPLKNQSSDMIFVADELGRFAFWTLQSGIVLCDNKIRSKSNPITFYKDIENNEGKTQFHGATYSFDVLDTEGNLFFTVGESLISITFLVRKKGKLKIKELVELTIPYNEVIYVGLIDGHHKKFGIIQQKQQRRYLRLHSLFTFQCLETIQKNNLISFISSHKGELVTLSYSDICIYKDKFIDPVSTFKISEPGFLTKLQDEKYAYIGESASELIIFSKKKYKNYGSFMLQNDACIEIGSYGILPDGGYLLSVVDQGYTVEFIVVYENQWKSIKSIPGMSSIFMIQQINSLNECLAVTKVSDNIHQVGVITNREPCQLIKESKYENPVTNVFSVEKGKYMILSNSSNNTLFKYNFQANQFDMVCPFVQGKIVLATDHHVVTDSKIYSVSYGTGTFSQIIEDTAKIVHACFDGQYISFFCKNSSHKFFNIKTNSIDRIRKDCTSEYYWHFHGPEILLIGDYEQPKTLIHLPIFKGKDTINLKNEEMIVSMESKGELVIISFINAKIEVYSFNEKQTIHSIDAISEPLKLITCNSQLLAFGSTQAFYLTFQQQNPSFKPIQFDSMSEINLVTYLEDQKQILVLTNETAKTYELPKKNQKNVHFRIVSVHLSQGEENMPFAIIPQDSSSVYIASSYEIVIKNLYNGEVQKQQTHILKEINCIEELKSGVLVGGIDDMEYGNIILFSFLDLQALCTINLGSQVVAGNIKKIDENNFAIRNNNYLIMETINQKNIPKQKFKYKTNLNGYTLTVNGANSMVVLTDPLKYLVAFDYRHNTLTSLCRYSNHNMINYCEFLSDSLICGDSAGYIQALQFNFQSDDISKTLMTSVGGLNIGTEIMMMNEKDNKLIYAAMSGFVGKLEKIEEDQFEILKEGQRRIFDKIEKEGYMKYSIWRHRQNLDDKMIDSFLIGKYLEEEESCPLYEKIKAISFKYQ